MAKAETGTPYMISPSQLTYFGSVIEEHKDWEFKNFGRQSPIRALLGMQEEVGELSHAVLKASQNIRMTQEDARVKMKDSIGDAIVYLISFCNKVGADLFKERSPAQIVEFCLGNGVRSSCDLADPENEIPLLLGGIVFSLHDAFVDEYDVENGDFDHEKPEYSAEFIELVENLSLMFLTYCNHLSDLVFNCNFVDCLREAWEEVKTRDWVYNPWSGQKPLPLE